MADVSYLTKTELSPFNAFGGFNRSLLRKVGNFSYILDKNGDKRAVWYPKNEYMVPGSFQVTSPENNTRCYMHHFYSHKYSKLLLVYRPDLYIELIKHRDREKDQQISELKIHAMRALILKTDKSFKHILDKITNEEKEVIENGKE